MPTLYELSLSEQKYVGFTQSLLETGTFAFNSSGLIANEFGAVDDKNWYRWSDDKFNSLEVVSTPPQGAEKLATKFGAMLGIVDEYLKNQK